MSQIEDILQDLEQYLLECKAPMIGGSGKLVVEKEMMEGFIDELRTYLPEDIRKYSRLVAQKDEVVKDAQRQAESIVNEARHLTEKLVSEHEISKQAHERAEKLMDSKRSEAQDIVDNAKNEADSIRMGAISYTDELLNKVQNLVENAARELDVNTSALMTNYQDIIATVKSNREELVRD